MAIKRKKENKLVVRPIEKPFDLWAEMDRLFDEFKAGFDDLFWPFGRIRDVTPSLSKRTPLTDVADLGDKYEMRMELPGIPKKAVNVEVTPTGIEISAEHDETTEDKGRNWLRRERSTMRFYRSLDLPEEIKTDDVEAELKDGVLTVMLPKVEPKPKLKAKKVKIK